MGRFGSWRLVLAWVLAVWGAVVSADTIPKSQTFVSAWHAAGLTLDDFPNPRQIVNVRDFGAYGNGTSNDYAAFNAAITSLNYKAGVVFIPAGNYYLRSPLNLRSGVVLRGQSSTNTTLTFSTNFFGHCINISGSAFGPFQFIQSGATLFSSQVTVTNPGVFSTGKYVSVRMYKPGNWTLSDWGTNSIGQLQRVVAITGSVLTLDQPLRLDYSPYEPQIATLNAPITNCGIENIRITRDLSSSTSTADQRDNTFTIHINNAADCWVRGVNLYKCFGGHIGLEYATHNEFRGNYIEEAHEYDGGGSGYGIRLEFYSCQNLAENNIFRKLRHSMLYQIGANANVLGYNYSREGRNEWSMQTSDITTHGNYPFANLAEGNIASFISLDNSHGWNGPYNTYYRNIATHSYGISDESTCRNEAFVGNETASAFDPSTSRAFCYGNTKSSGFVSTTSQAWSNLYDYSYYLATNPMVAPAKPGWWNIPQNHLWPIGPTNANNYSTTKYIPAKSRYDAGGLKTYAPPSAERLPPETVLAYPGDTVTLTSKAHGSPSVAYAWFKNGAAIPGATSSNLTLSGLSAADQGAYTVSFTDGSGSITSPPTGVFLFDGALHFTNDHGFLDVAANWDPPVGPPDSAETGVIASAGAPVEAVFRTNLFEIPAELIVATGGVLSLDTSLTTEHRLTLDGGSVKTFDGDVSVGRSAALKSDSTVGSASGLLSLRWKLSDHAAGAGKLIVSNDGAGAVAVYSIASSYSGGTELRAGDMLLYSNQATGVGTLDIMPAGNLKIMAATVIQTNPVALHGGRLTPGVSGAFKAPIQMRADSFACAVNTNSLALYGPIVDHADGAGRLIVSNNGSGWLSFYSINSTYSGGTELQRGDMLVWSNAATGIGPVEVLPGGVFKPALATLIQTNPVVLSGGWMIPHVTSAFKAPIQVRAESALGSTNAFILSVYGPISDYPGGAGRLVVSNTGPGFVAFYGINSTYSGGTEVRLGSLLVYSNDATGIGPVDVMPDGLFKPSLATLIQTNPVVLRGGRMVPHITSTFKAPIQIRSESVIGSTNASILSVYGPILDHADGTGKLIVSNTGAGTVNFYSINSTYSGGTEVRLGNLLIYSNYAIGTGRLEVMPDGTLQAGASTVQSAPAVLRGGRFYTAGNYIYNGPIEVAMESFLDSTGATSAVLSGPIRDFDGTHTGRLIKKGTGFLGLSGGTNLFSGGLEVREGTLSCTVNGSLGSGGVDVLAGAVLYLNGCSNASLGAGAIVIESNATLQVISSYSINVTVRPGAVVRGVAGNQNTYDRLRIEGDVQFQRQSGSGYMNYRGVISDGAVPGRFILATTNPLPVYLYATNLYTGGTRLTDGWTNKVGELVLAAGGSLPDTGTVTLESNAVFNLAGNSDVIGSLEGFGEVKLGAVAATRLTVADGRETVFAGALTGTGGLVRAGAGALTLAGTNLWAGVTVVTGGLLRVNGTLAAGGPVTVYSNGFLGGSGLIGRAVELKPGAGFDWRDQPAALTLVTNGTFVLATNALFRYRFNAVTGSCLIVQGTLQLPAAAVVEPLPLPGAEARGPFDAVLMRADALSGAGSLAGWTVRGRAYVVDRTATAVWLHYRPSGTLILVR